MIKPSALSDELNRHGYARLPGLLPAPDCEEIARIWNEPKRFRKEIVMARHGYGEGEYRYFDYPLPTIVEELRTSAYAALVPAANLHQERLGLDERFPDSLGAYLERCHAAGQKRATPLLLRYLAGGFNRLHQDRYGELAFPFQLVVMLSRSPRDAGSADAREPDFEGGEFLLTEGRPRMQTKGTALQLSQGEGLVFANQLRAVESKRGYARAAVRHGVSEVTRGERVTLGVIFHDAA